MGNIYDCFLKAKKNISNSSFFEKLDIIKFEFDGILYQVFYTKKRANRYSIVHCNGNTISWEQFPVLPRAVGRLSGIKEPLISISPNSSVITIFVIKGKPNSIVGLDDGAFRSVHKFDKAYINVMSEACFKEL